MSHNFVPLSELSVMRCLRINPKLLSLLLVFSWAFETLAALPSARTMAATAVTSRSAALNGYAAANDWAGYAWFQYGPTTAYGSQSGYITLGPAAQNVSANALGLVPNTVYHFRLACVNSYTTVYGADMSFTTPGEPPAVQTQSASEITTNSAKLNASISPGGQNASAYFDYGVSTVYSSRTPLVNFGGTAGPYSCTITGLTAATTYHYRVVGENATGAGYGADVSVTTITPPPQLRVVGTSSNGFSFELLTGCPGIFVVQGSSNLVNWSGVATFTNPAPSVTVTDALGSVTHKFYRAYKQ